MSTSNEEDSKSKVESSSRFFLKHLISDIMDIQDIAVSVFRDQRHSADKKKELILFLMNTILSKAATIDGVIGD